ncbi:hypothetical protein OL383_004421 [Salmonella enterica]|nr:hypothetical protein [Salmonella enterica]
MENNNLPTVSELEQLRSENNKLRAKAIRQATQILEVGFENQRLKHQIKELDFPQCVDRVAELLEPGRKLEIVKTLSGDTIAIVLSVPKKGASNE